VTPGEVDEDRTDQPFPDALRQRGILLDVIELANAPGGGALCPHRETAAKSWDYHQRNHQFLRDLTAGARHLHRPPCHVNGQEASVDLRDRVTRVVRKMPAKCGPSTVP